MDVKKVLFPTDFSEASTHALPHALELARRLDAEIHVIHVRTPYSDDPNREEYQFFDEGRYCEFVEEQLANTSEGIEASHRVTSSVEREVSPAAGILAYVEREGVDLVAMGTHGRSAIAHFFLGSVAERVVRHCPVPVLTVAPAREGYRDGPAYERILIAYDFSEYSKEAALQGCALAEEYGAHVEILYVIEQEIHPGYYQVWKTSVQRELPQLVADARRSLERVLGEQGLAHVDVHVEVGDGDGRVHRDITRHARETNSDLIVMGTYGLSGIEHMLLGSTTERVVRVAPCPVLTFHLGGTV